jgi:hypothetical protein
MERNARANQESAERRAPPQAAHGIDAKITVGGERRAAAAG